jgi:thiamine biosynthesis protein ThiS
MAIQIFVNGQPAAAPGALSVKELLAFLKIDASRVAVELNRAIVHKQDWNSAMVNEGAQVEIVWFVGGGSIAAISL